MSFLCMGVLIRGSNRHLIFSLLTPLPTISLSPPWEYFNLPYLIWWVKLWLKFCHWFSVNCLSAVNSRICLSWGRMLKFPIFVLFPVISVFHKVMYWQLGLFLWQLFLNSGLMTDYKKICKLIWSGDTVHSTP